MFARPRQTNISLPPGGRGTAIAVEGERVQNKGSANSKVAQAPSVKCSAFATSLSEGGKSYNRTSPLSVILSEGEAAAELLRVE